MTNSEFNKKSKATDGVSIKPDPDAAYLKQQRHPNGGATRDGVHGNDNGNNGGQDDDEDGESDDIFEVEGVVGHRREKGQGLFYFIRWKGYGDADRTWEPENGVFCHDMVKNYWDRYVRAGGKETDTFGLDPKPQPEGKNNHLQSGNAKSSSEALLPDLTPLMNQEASPATSPIKKQNNTKGHGFSKKGERSKSQERSESQERSKGQDRSKNQDRVDKEQKHVRARSEVPASTAKSKGYNRAIDDGGVPSTVALKSKSNDVPIRKGSLKSDGMENRNEVNKESHPSKVIHDRDSRGMRIPPKRQKIGGNLEEQDLRKQPPMPTSWEDLVDHVDSVEQRAIDGELIVHLFWKAGKYTEHSREEVRKRCPQKLLDFYESCLQFKEEQQ